MCMLCFLTNERNKKRNMYLITMINYLTNVPYESLILVQLLDLISPVKINLFDPRFKSYDPYNMEN